MTGDSLSTTPAARLGLVVEAVFPIAAAQAYIWLMPHERPRWLDAFFGIVVGVIVVVYVLRRGLTGWRTFGLARSDDHLWAALPVGVFTLVTVGVLLLWGWHGGGLRQDWDLLGALAAYPIWGLLQQTLMLAVVYPRMRLVAGVTAAPILTALLFAAAHSPNPLLMAGGMLMVFIYSLTWERWPSLPVVAISHGVIGAVCDKALHVSMRVGAHYFET